MTVIQVKTTEEFNQLQKKVGVLVSHFHAEWAPQCKQINDVLAELALQPDTKGVVFAAVQAEEVPEVSQRLGVTAVPTVVVTCTSEEGTASTVAGRVDGARPGDVTDLVKRIATKAFLTGIGVTAPPALQETKEDLNNRIKKIIHSAPCMLFMKGSPDSPKCGFSRTTVELLARHNTQYSTFDILTDEAVRQGLKIYSDFPTYPQLYVKGELIGGLDIMKEMDAADELADMLPRKALLEDRLKALTHQAPLMVFMKGDRDGPRCGFSRTLMEILKESGLPFETFDILSDEEVRQGLKTFSNWPTYPQVYVKGELIGGLDIIKEMKSDGSLLEALKGN